MNNNKLIIAAAGSGKTTFLVNQAKAIRNDNVLLTTYTEANRDGIREKFNGYIPKNITIQTWFSFLLQHGVRPYQSILKEELHDKKISFFLTSKSSTGYKGTDGRNCSWSRERNFFQYYFNKKMDLKICSDTIADFVFHCNEKSDGEVINRISKIYPYIFIDEVQDLAGWELEVLKLLFRSQSTVMLVGDPRQITYLTHHPRKNTTKRNNKKGFLSIDEYIKKNRLDKLCPIDTSTLKNSHRNNQGICDFSSRLFPEHEKCEPCLCENCHKQTNHDGIFLVRKSDVSNYCLKYPQVTVLREKESVFPEWNFGKSKGLTFDRVLIYPTQGIVKWLKDNKSPLTLSTRCKFYVALTRARHSAAIVYDYKKGDNIEGTTKWQG